MKENIFYEKYDVYRAPEPFGTIRRKATAKDDTKRSSPRSRCLHIHFWSPLDHCHSSSRFRFNYLIPPNKLTRKYPTGADWICQEKLLTNSLPGWNNIEPWFHLSRRLPSVINSVSIYKKITVQYYLFTVKEEDISVPNLSLRRRYQHQYPEHNGHNSNSAPHLPEDHE